MKFKKPNQHGVWAMLIVPFLFGIFAGKFSLFHILFILGWFLVFFATDNYLFYVKKRKKQIGYLKSSAMFGSLAALLFIPVVIHQPKVLFLFLLMMPFAYINIYFAKMRNERHVLNDVCAVTIFSIAGVISYYIGTSHINRVAALVFMMSMLYFGGTILYVKTMIREKKNDTYKWMSFIYHIFLVSLGFLLSPVIGLAAVPSLIRAVGFYGRNLKPIKIGIVEIANACFITFMVAIYFYQ